MSNAARITGWQSVDVFYVEDSKIWYGLGLMLGEELKQKKAHDAATAQARTEPID